MSRKENTSKNFVTSLSSECLIMVLKFVTRTIFINVLGREYLGINSLFTNILQMLSLTEFGLASALDYKLYKPLAMRDYNRVRILMKFYKSAYRLIGSTILGLGVSLIPLLPILIKDYDSLLALGINAVFIYLLYLLQSVSTYFFFSYKSALIKADQKEYKLTVASYGITLASYTTQIIILVLLHNFVVYTVSLIFFNIFQNFVYAKIVDRNYPFISERTEGKLTKEEIKDLFRDCYALFIYKVQQVVLNATDNIILSAFIGLAIVGEYSNYMMIFNQIKIIMIKCFLAVQASLGNFHATEKKIEKEYLLFKAINLFTLITYGSAVVGTFVVGDNFISAWIGNDYVMGKKFCLLLGIEIYILGIRQFMGSYRTTMGLFQQGKYRPLIGIILNIILSIVLVRPMGVYGVMLGTILSDCMTMLWIDPIIIFKYGFKNYRPVREYFLKNIYYGMILILAIILSGSVCNLIMGTGWLLVLLQIIICGLITCLLFILFNLRSEEVQYIKKQLTSIVLNFTKNRKGSRKD